MPSIRKMFIIVLLLCGVSVASLYGIGSYIIAPRRHTIEANVTGLKIEPVSFQSLSGGLIKGWFIAGQKPSGIILMHGVRSDRTSMLQRAQFLNKAGYNILLFDFQAHGESTGSYITFGYLESRDAQAAIRFMRTQKNINKIGALGVSMGAASLLLADGGQADALVAEAPYTDIHDAIKSRLRMRLGFLGGYLEPLLSIQLKWRLGIDPNELSPISHAGLIHAPILFIGGEKDKHAPLSGVESLYNAANNPKEFWVVKGATHLDFDKYLGPAYEQKIITFFDKNLAAPQ